LPQEQKCGHSSTNLSHFWIHSTPAEVSAVDIPHGHAQIETLLHASVG
jgi:hypothetical protein